jgi:hypothetical protein
MAVRNGEVGAICVIADDDITRDALREWSADPDVTAILKAPIEVARKCWQVSQDEALRLMRGQP